MEYIAARRPSHWAFAGLLCLAVGCAESRDDNGGLEGGGGLPGIGDDDGAGETGETGAATSDGLASESGDPTGGAPKLDVNPGPGTGQADDGGGETGCDKIDFLFVVDNSSSMQAVQQNLNASFPGFIATIREEVEGTDYQIMVVDSDDDPTWYCEPAVHAAHPACGGNCPGTCDPGDPNCVDYTCGDNSSVLDVDDKTMGCGIVRPYGGRASNTDCGIEGGHRYLTATQPDIESTFECIAKVGVSGSWWEMPVSSMLAAVSPELNGPGGCNEGFLRDDAILVVAFISDDAVNDPDDDDVKPGINGTPQEWFDQLVDAKGGNVDAIVMLGVVVRPINIFGIQIGAEKFTDFIDLFGAQGMTVYADEPNYSPFFETAVGLIDTTCDEFDPEG